MTSERAGGKADAGGWHADIDQAASYLDKWQIDVARDRLKSLRTQHWDVLSPREKYRVVANLGNCALREGDYATAGKLFIEAKSYNPTDEDARAKEAVGYALIGDNSAAFARAALLRTEFPNNLDALLALILSAPATAPFGEIAKAVPTSLGDNPRMLLALGHRAISCGEHRAAEAYARKAVKADGALMEAKHLLATAILKVETEDFFGVDTPTLAEPAIKRLSESLALFGECLDDARAKKDVNFTVDASLNRAITYRLLGDATGADKDLERAYALAPDDKDASIKYAFLLFDRDKPNEAINILRACLEKHAAPQAALALAVELHKRNSSGDRHEAGIIADKLLSKAERPDVLLRAELVNLRLQLFVDAGNCADGEKLLAALPDGYLTPILNCTVRANFYRQAGNGEMVTTVTRELDQHLSDTNRKPELRSAALLYMRQGDYHRAVEVWRRIIIPERVGRDTYALLESAERSSDHGFIMQFCEQLRKHGIYDQTCIACEVNVLLHYDAEAAVALLKEALDRRPGDKRARLLLSQIGIQRLDPTVVCGDPAMLPACDEVTPILGVQVVYVLRHVGRSPEAVAYAYALWRRFPDDEAANMAVIASMSVFWGPEPEIPEMTHVAVSAAVRYREKGAHQDSWAIIEDTAHPRSDLREIPLTHPVAQGMLGKSVNEEFTIADGMGVQARTGVILEIVHKFIYRYRDCMDGWEMRFPRSNFLRKFDIPSISQEGGGAPKLDLSSLEKILAQRAKQVHEVLDFYAANPMPIHVLAERLGHNMFETMSGLLSDKTPGVRYCQGSVLERQQATEGLCESKTLVLDITALWTLFFLDAYETVASLPINLVISQAALADIKNSCFAVRQGPPSKTVAARDEGGISVIEKTEEDKQGLISRLERFIAALEGSAHYHIENDRALACLAATPREQLADCFGTATAAGIAAAEKLHAPLWTDDLVVGLIAEREHGVRRIWTQAVLLWCGEHGTMRQELVDEMSAKLIGFNYKYTAMCTNTVLRAAELASWSPDGWPLMQVVREFALPDLDLAARSALLARLLKDIWQRAPLSITAQTVTYRILDKIAQQGGGRRIIEKAKLGIATVFGVDVVNADMVAKVLEAWTAANQSRIILP